jgi:CHAT domain-containing protein
MIKYVVLLFCSIAISSFAQNYADKGYYLIDSLELDKVSPAYKVLLDSNLTHYHASQNDVERVWYVNLIVKQCWDENIWPKYNKWVYNFTSEKLIGEENEEMRAYLLQAKAGAVYYVAWSHGTRNEYDLCLEKYQECKTIYEEIGDSIGVANILDNIGSIHMSKGEFAEALEYQNQSYQLRKALNHVLGMGASMNSMGSLHFAHGDYEKAKEEFEQALKFHTESKFYSGVSNALSNLGSIEMLLKNYDGANEYLIQSLEMKAQLEDKLGMATTQTLLGELSLIKGDTLAAYKYYSDCFKLSSDGQNEIGIAGALCNLGFLSKLKGDFPDAIKKFEEAKQLTTDLGANIQKRSALLGLFSSYLMLDEFDKAEAELVELVELRRNDIRVNFAVLAEHEKELYFATMAEDFMNIYSFASYRKEENPLILEMAYDNALKLKGFLLKSSTALREALLSSKDDDLLSTYDKWMELKTQVADAYAQGGAVDSLELLSDNLEKDLTIRSKSFSKFSASSDIGWKDVKNKLSKDEVALEFIAFNSQFGNPESSLHYAALMVSPSSKHPKMIELCSAEELDKVLGTTEAKNFNYINELYGTSNETNKALYNLVWAPLEQELINVRTIYFSPEGSLHKISFPALSDKNDSFLCDKYDLIQLSSTAEVVNETPFKINQKSKATLFGGVKYSTENTEHVIWTYLPGSLSEIDSINSTVKNKLEVNFYSKEDATEENFKAAASESQFLHLASHGFFYPDPDLVREQTKKELDQEDVNFRGGIVNYGIWNFVNNKNPLMRSGLVLAGANDVWDRDVFEEGEDGVLSAQEVTTLNMQNTDLVVLSACETGLGDIRGSEGVYGLQRAFKMAGVRFLIMSLWQVPDKETSEFMSLFYKNLFEFKGVKEAFSATQKVMRSKYDPYFWAAFVLVE